MRERNQPEQSGKRKEEKYAINEEITAKEVRVIGVSGEQIGVLRIEAALQMAEESEVDLVEVAPEAKPPVCRLLDYGKLKYKGQKKAAEARKRSSSHTVKELRIRYSTDKHDLETKVRNARRFLEDGDRVRFQMRFKGREVVYESLGRATMQQVVELLADVGVVDDLSPLVGQRIILSLAPKPKG